MRDKSEITTANPNKPTKAAAKGTPDSRSIDPKVNLSIASVLSIPTAPINKPILTPINPFSIEPRVNAETMTKPIIAISAMSAFEDLSAMLEINGIQVTAMIQLVAPPKKMSKLHNLMQVLIVLFRPLGNHLVLYMHQLVCQEFLIK